MVQEHPRAYAFDFVEIADDALEREVERALLSRIRDFLLELGSGFSFVGSQVRLGVGGEEFFLDLLFFHLRLRCFIVVDLKVGNFKPEYAGKMNFYLAAVDDLWRTEHDGPSIGLILCRTSNRVVAEYALRDAGKPIGVAEYRLTSSLPERLRNSLPAIEEIESRLRLPQEKEE